MTITVNGDEKTLEQVVKQLAKLIDVLKVEELEARTLCDAGTSLDKS